MLSRAGTRSIQGALWDPGARRREGGPSSSPSLSPSKGRALQCPGWSHPLWHPIPSLQPREVISPTPMFPADPEKAFFFFFFGYSIVCLFGVFEISLVRPSFGSESLGPDKVVGPLPTWPPGHRAGPPRKESPASPAPHGQGRTSSKPCAPHPLHPSP